MHSPRFGSCPRTSCVALLLASVAVAALLSGCGGGGNGAPPPSAAVSSVPRSAGGLEFTASADHAVYSKTDPITLAYAITGQSVAGLPVLASVDGNIGWFFADAVRGSQTIHLVGDAGPGNTADGTQGEGFSIYDGETVAYQNTVAAGSLPPGAWRITCRLWGSVAGVGENEQPPYLYVTNAVTITVLR